MHKKLITIIIIFSYCLMPKPAFARAGGFAAGGSAGGHYSPSRSSHYDSHSFNRFHGYGYHRSGASPHTQYSSSMPLIRLDILHRILGLGELIQPIKAFSTGLQVQAAHNIFILNCTALIAIASILLFKVPTAILFVSLLISGLSMPFAVYSFLQWYQFSATMDSLQYLIFWSALCSTVPCSLLAYVISAGNGDNGPKKNRHLAKSQQSMYPWDDESQIAFITWVENAYRSMQHAITQRDVTLAQTYIGAKLMHEHRRTIQAHLDNKQINKIENIRVQGISIKKDEANEKWVKLTADMCDYVVDENNKLVSGSRKSTTVSDTLVLRKNADGWYVYNIIPESANQDSWTMLGLYSVMGFLFALCLKYFNL